MSLERKDIKHFMNATKIPNVSQHYKKKYQSLAKKYMKKFFPKVVLCVELHCMVPMVG